MPPESLQPGSPASWLSFAESDLALASVKNPNVLHNALCFQAQQATEKAVKAVLVAEGIAFPKTHNIGFL